MAERLKNILTFTDLAQGAVVVLPHGLHTSVGRPLAPDIIFVPSEFLEVVSDKTNVTLTNLGPTVLSGSILVEAWHTIERAFNDVNDEDLPVKPYVVVSPEGGNQPAQPPFNPSDVFIYARLSGSDTTGDGTLAKPYRTFQRAIRDVPTNVPAGIIYHVDITGIGMETLPDEYECPTFIASEGIGDFDFAEPYFYYYGAVNIIATPQPATGVSGITTIPAGAISVPKASTGLQKINVPGAGWTPGQLKGKFCLSSGPATQHSVIWDNDANNIWITSIIPPTFPLQIAECSAGLQANKDPGDLHRAAVNFRNTQVMLGGLKIRSLSAAAGPFGGWSLQIAGNTPPTSIQLCDVQGAGLVGGGSSWVRTRQCYLKDSLFLIAPMAITQTFLDGSLEVVPSGPRVSMWPGARGVDSMVKQSVASKMVPLHPRDLFDTFSSAPINLLTLQNVQILDSIAEFPPNGEDGGSLDGILWTGVLLQMWGVDISRTPGDPNFGLGTALHVRGNSSLAVLRGVTGSGYALGAYFENGGNGEIDDVPLGIPTTLAGTGGVQQTGSNAAAAWPAAVYPAAGSNITDYAAAAAQGSRLWRRS